MSTVFRSDGWVKSALGQAVAGALIYVCTQPANTSVLPPSPLASIFSDPGGLVPIVQPISADGLGHYDFYVAPGTYTVIVANFGEIQEVYPDQSTFGFGPGSLVAGANITIVGNVISAVGFLSSTPLADQSILSYNLLPATGNTTQSLGSPTAPWNVVAYNLTVQNNVLGNLLPLPGNTTQTLGNLNAPWDATLWNAVVIDLLDLVNIAPATVSTANDSPPLFFQSNFWTGSVSAEDTWTVQQVLTAGVNAPSALNITHSGSLGNATVNLGTGGNVVGLTFNSDTGISRLSSGILGIGTGVPGTDTGTLSLATLQVSSGISLNSGNAIVWNLDAGISRLSSDTLAIGNGTAGDFSGTLKTTVVNAVTGFQINGAATLGNVLVGNGTDFVSTAPSGIGVAFSAITTGVNTTAAMTLGSGSVLTTSGTGTILNATLTTTSAGPTQILDVTDTTSYVVLGINSGVSGYPAFIHFTDAFTYNAALGTDASGDLQFWAGRQPTVAGTLEFSISQSGNAFLNGAVTGLGGQTMTGALGVSGVVFKSTLTGLTTVAGGDTSYTTTAAGVFRVCSNIYPTTLSSSAWAIYSICTCTQSGATGASTMTVGPEVTIGTTYSIEANSVSAIYNMSSGATLTLGVLAASGSNTGGVYTVVWTVERLA